MAKKDKHLENTRKKKSSKLLNMHRRHQFVKQRKYSDITQLRYINNVKYYLYPVLSRNNNNDLAIPVFE